MKKRSKKEFNLDEMIKRHAGKVEETQAENEKLTAKLLQNSQAHLDKIRKKNEKFRNR